MEAWKGWFRYNQKKFTFKGLTLKDTERNDAIAYKNSFKGNILDELCNDKCVMTKLKGNISCVYEYLLY